MKKITKDMKQVLAKWSGANQPEGSPSSNNLYASLRGIHEVQRLNLRLMELASFNEFNGPEVVKSLLDNKELWQACVMDRSTFFSVEELNERKGNWSICLIKLRDMGEETTKRLGQGCWNVDTLFILPSQDKLEQAKIYKLAKTWNADEVNWIGWPVAGSLLGGYFHKATRILRVWWG